MKSSKWMSKLHSLVDFLKKSCIWCNQNIFSIWKVLTKYANYSDPSMDWCMIRLQRIYNFLLFHAVILSLLDVLYTFTSNFISFLGHCAQCYLLFLLVFYFAEYQYQTKSKCHEIFWRFFSGRKAPMKFLEGTRGRSLGLLGTMVQKGPPTCPGV